MCMQNKMQPHQLNKAQVKLRLFPRVTVAKSLENNTNIAASVFFF